MSRLYDKYRFLILRRIVQLGLLFLYIAANVWGWKILQGNLSSSLILETVPLADPYAALQMFAAGSAMAANLLIGAAIITGFYMIIGGRAFCSWVCPVNMITDLANFLRRKLGIDRIHKKQPSSRNMRYWVLGLGLVLSFALGVTAFEFVSPIGMTHRGIIFGFGFGLAAMLVIFLFDLFVLKNGWCGHICPLGGFYSLIGRFSFIRVHHDESKCTACMKCKLICPEDQVLDMIGKESAPVVSGECINCGRCIEVCDDDALEFSIKNLRTNAKKEESSNETK